MLLHSRSKRPLLVPEQLTLNKFRRNSCTVHLNKAHTAATTQLVQVAGYQLLTRTVRSGNQHPRIGRRHFGNDIPDMHHRRRSTYHIHPVNLLLQSLVLGGKRRSLSRVLDGNQQSLKVKRLLHKVKCPLLDALHSRRDVPVAGDHHHSRVKVHLHKLLEHLNPVHTGHLDVAENHIESLFFNRLQGTETILCLRNLITFVHQNLPEGIPDGPIVINYQNLHTIKQLSETYPISAPFTSASWGVIKRILPSF